MVGRHLAKSTSGNTIPAFLPPSCVDEEYMYITSYSTCTHKQHVHIHVHCVYLAMIQCSTAGNVLWAYSNTQAWMFLCQSWPCPQALGYKFCYYLENLRTRLCQPMLALFSTNNHSILHGTPNTMYSTCRQINLGTQQQIINSEDLVGYILGISEP